MSVNFFFTSAYSLEPLNNPFTDGNVPNILNSSILPHLFYKKIVDKQKNI